MSLNDYKALDLLYICVQSLLDSLDVEASSYTHSGSHYVGAIVLKLITSRLIANILRARPHQCSNEV